MTKNEFTKVFLPHIIAEYIKGTLPFHALVDLDTWKKVFPDDELTQKNQIQWHEVVLTCNPLVDGTLLLSFILPRPRNYEEIEYAAIRLNPAEHAVRRAVYYVLSKPPRVDDPWDILYLPLSQESESFELKFKKKIRGSDNLCNFVHDVQQIDFNDDSYNWSFIDGLKKYVINMLKPQDNDN